MQVYTIYAPQHHTPGKVQQTKAVADTADDAPRLAAAARKPAVFPRR